MPHPDQVDDGCRRVDLLRRGIRVLQPVQEVVQVRGDPESTLESFLGALIDADAKKVPRGKKKPQLR